MTIHRLHGIFLKQLDRHHQHVTIVEHTHPRRSIQQQVGLLESVTQVGSHGDAALHHIGFEYDAIAIFRRRGKRQGAASYADGHSLSEVSCF